MSIDHVSLLTSVYHVSLPKDHRKILKDPVHTEESTFEYTLKNQINHFLIILLNKQTIVTNRNTMQHVHQNNLLYD
jgi:hypothetical protein